MSFLAKQDPNVKAVIDQELMRQRDKLEMIASENIVSQAVMEAQGSVLTNKYAEGYPGKRYYGGCEHVDVVETLAIERAKRLFGAEHANVQPHSGSQANFAVYFAMLKPGDTIVGMNLSHGGHLTHGSPVNVSGTYFNVVPYGVNAETQQIDYDEFRKIVLEAKPKLIIAGGSAYSRQIDFKKMADVAHEVGAIFMVDMAHFAGLVAAGLHPNPVEYADIVTTTTHKTLRGPRGGMDAARPAGLPAGLRGRLAGQHLVDAGGPVLLGGDLRGRGAHAGGLQPRAALPVALHRGAPGQRRRLARGPGRRGRGGHQPALPQPQGGAHRGRRGHSGPGPGGPVRRHRGAARGAGGHDRPVHGTDPAVGLGPGGGGRRRRGGGGHPDHPQGAHLGVGQDRAHLPPGVATARVGHVQSDASCPGRGRRAHADPVLHPVLQREPVGLRLHGALRGPGHHLPGLQHSGLDRALPRRYRAGRARPDRRARRRRRPLRGGAVHGDRLPPGDLLDPDPGGLAQPPAPPEGRRPVVRVHGQGPVMKVPSIRAGHAWAEAPTR